MAKNAVSPSGEAITKGQCSKLMDVGVDALVKSGLPLETTQYVIEHESANIAANLVADVRHRVEARLRAIEPHVLERLPFDPETFLGKGWSVDERVGQRTGGNLDVGRIVLKGYLRQGESSITGEERLNRIKASDDIQLDAEDFLALWEEEGHVTLCWLYATKGISWLSFWGTIFCSPPHGRRNVLYLYRGDDGSWGWYDSWLGSVWRGSHPSAVLASN